VLLPGRRTKAGRPWPAGYVPGIEPADRATPLRTIWRGVTRRCPRCGRGKLFRRWTRIAARCPRCGVELERGEGFTLGVMTVNLGVLFVVAITYLVVAFALTLPDPPVATLTIIGVASGLVVPVLTLPFAKTTWLALDLLMRPVGADEAADAAAWVAGARRERTAAERRRLDASR
jgi:uncharacterized protein (DUF983 family)